MCDHDGRSLGRTGNPIDRRWRGADIKRGNRQPRARSFEVPNARAAQQKPRDRRKPMPHAHGRQTATALAIMPST
jgi:hypothetical protein